MRITEMILLPLLSMIVIFLLTKMMGYRQITQLSLYDYIIGITIGSIASELAVAHFDDFFQPVIAMVIFGIGTWLFSYLTKKEQYQVIDNIMTNIRSNNLNIYFTPKIKNWILFVISN